MRRPRLKPDYQDSWHHVYNRIAGIPSDLPFGPAEKAMFIRILFRLSRLYTVRILAYQVMSNHYHLILQTPKDTPSIEETCQRFTNFHHGHRFLDPQSPLCAQWQLRLRDVSWFMRHLQHLFTVWYNHSRPIPRRGTLWAGRFKNTLLEGGLAVWNCWKYIELNPLRAGMVRDPADYRFCSLGRWVQKGQHPFPETLVQLALPALESLLMVHSPQELQQLLRQEVARVVAEEGGLNTAETEQAVAQAGEPIRFSSMLRYRMRYWVDGAVIGSELFIREVMGRVRGAEYMLKRRLTPAQDEPAGIRLYSYRQLRHLVQ